MNEPYVQPPMPNESKRGSCAACIDWRSSANQAAASCVSACSAAATILREVMALRNCLQGYDVSAEVWRCNQFNELRREGWM